MREGEEKKEDGQILLWSFFTFKIVKIFLKRKMGICILWMEYI